jgi:exopolyphosphatase/guanosine-5'-triphosphate,3'-diphosphate pyrophosphatase
MSRIAAVDLGSLTVRLALAEVTGPGRFQVLEQHRQVTGLGRGLTGAGPLSPAGVAATLAALAAFGALLKERQVSRARAVATQAVRQATDGREFLRQAAAVLGGPVDLISPGEEARLTLQGILTVLEPAVPAAGPVLVFDIGGGSSEFVLLRPGTEPVFAGLPLGVLSLSALLPVSDPPRAAEVAALKTEVARRLEMFYKEYFTGLPGPQALVGTAGAVTTLAAMAQELQDYEAARINNYRLTRARLLELAESICRLPEAERARLPGLEPAKAGVMVAGVILVLAILDLCRREDLICVDAGLLEGILAELAR